ncbi:hypothetical protein N0V90_012889 [Kalmusia sp. IMI 367209]|nr:hypothetical protein N0V90_012889 [Kalmusia sp. IMI 367209]
MSTHLPLRLHRPLPLQCVRSPLSSRPFSSTKPAWARTPSGTRKRGRVDPVIAETAARHQQGKASSAMQEEQLSDERNVPDDIGLIPGTFVHAPLFPWTPLSLKERLWYEWKWATSRVTAWFQLWRFKRSFRSKPDMYFFGNRKQLSHKALEKYKHLYQSFARADSNALSELCVSSVAKKFQTRIDSRPSGLKMHWRIDGNPTCTIVSNAANPLSLPGYEETGVHQVVFRIRSNQTLQLTGSREFPESAAGYKAKSDKVTEYLVLQRQFIRGSDKDWMIWGFTDFSTRKTIDDGEEYARRVNAFQVA